MKRLFLCLLVFYSTLLLASDGTFTGKVVNGPNLNSNQKWIYVQSAKGAVRRVEISKADITYSSKVAKTERAAKLEDAIQEGSEIRITATQDSDGEWQASRVEILAVKATKITNNK